MLPGSLPRINFSVSRLGSGMHPLIRPRISPLFSWGAIFCLGFFLLSLWYVWGPVFRKGGGILDASGKPLGGDFSQFYAASVVTLTQGGQKNFDEESYRATYQRSIGSRLPYRWVYPPSFLLVTTPLALLPYQAALALWLAFTLSLYVLVMARLLPRFSESVLYLAFPPVFFNIVNGQNGFLTTALFGGGLLLLERWPVTAGLVLGCLSYKPHLAMLLPLALGAGRHWRALGGMCLAVAGWITASSLAFGWGVWPEFMKSLAKSVSCLENATPTWHKMVSTYAAARLAGLGSYGAWFLQGLIAAVAAAGVIWIWGRQGRQPLRYAALVLGSLLAAPHAFFYDLTLLALPLAWLALEGWVAGWQPGEKVLLTLSWLAPLVTFGLQQLHGGLSITPWLLLSLFSLTLRRQVRFETASTQSPEVGNRPKGE